MSTEENSMKILALDQSPLYAQQLLRLAAFLCLSLANTTVQAEVIDLRPALVEKGDVVGVEYRSGEALIGRSTDAAPSGVELLMPGAKAVPVQFRTNTERDGVLDLGPVKIGTLTFRWRINFACRLTPGGCF
jgi:hypothetical protein